MSAILILLALLSLGTLASRQGAVQLLARVAATPILVGLGYALFSRSALAFVPPSTTDELQPALRIGCVWMALMLSLSVPRPGRSARSMRNASLPLLVALGTGGLTTLASYAALVALGEGWKGGYGGAWTSLPMIGVAVVVGGLVQGSASTRASGPELRSGLTTFIRPGEVTLHEEALAVVVACIALAVWPDASRTGVYAFGWLAIPILVLLGATAAVVQRLVSFGNEDTEARTINLLGLVILLTGFVHGLSMPAVPVVFFFGLFLSLTRLGRGLLARLAGTERPVRMVVLVLTGAYIGFKLGPVCVGVAAGVARAGAKWLAGTLLRRAGLEVSLPALLSAPRLAVPLAISLTWSENLSLRESGLITAVVVALTVSDLITLIVLLARPREQSLRTAEVRS
ncbi:MAG: hypothetical protein IT384_07845 [Deltaproteobacteria bacterium]|nr:hypothetical protein [Deltaproteobacteria bacterium]